MYDRLLFFILYSGKQRCWTWPGFKFLQDPQEKEFLFFFLFILQEANSVLHSTSSSLLIDIQAMYVCAWS